MMLHGYPRVYVDVLACVFVLYEVPRFFLCGVFETFEGLRVSRRISSYVMHAHHLSDSCNPSVCVVRSQFSHQNILTNHHQPFTSLTGSNTVL